MIGRFLVREFKLDASIRAARIAEPYTNKVEKNPHQVVLDAMDEQFDEDVHARVVRAVDAMHDRGRRVAVDESAIRRRARAIG